MARGRKPRAPILVPLVFYVTPEEKTEIQTAAGDLSVSRFCLDTMLGVARGKKLMSVIKIEAAPVQLELPVLYQAYSQAESILPSDATLTAAFGNRAKKAIEDSHAAGIPVHAMKDGEIVVVTPLPVPDIHVAVGPEVVDNVLSSEDIRATAPSLSSTIDPTSKSLFEPEEVPGELLEVMYSYKNKGGA